MHTLAQSPNPKSNLKNSNFFESNFMLLVQWVKQTWVNKNLSISSFSLTNPNPSPAQMLTLAIDRNPRSNQKTRS